MTRRYAGSLAYVLLPAVFALASQTTVFAQSSGPQPLVQGTTVTGQCTGHGSEPGCVLPNLFGSQGLSLANTPNFSHYAHFIGAAQQTLNQSLGTAIATQLAILPFISPASGFTYKYDSDAGAFVRSTTTFGPIYTERADTIGKGQVYMGVSYQRFRFNQLDGVDLKNAPAVFTHVENTGPGGTSPAYEKDVISSNNSITLNMDQTVVYGTVGLTDRIDVSLAVPFVSVRMGAISNDSIERISGLTFVLPGTNLVLPNPHQFTNGSLMQTVSSKGSAFGIGDLTVRVKGNILQTDVIRVALGLDIRTPTGDARQLLGSGSTGLKPFIAVSAGHRVSPHLNLGYQWNSSSILAGNITGVTISEDAAGNSLIQNGPSTKGHVPSNFIFSMGADIGVTKRLTLAFDYLGQTVFNAPRIAKAAPTQVTTPDSPAPVTLVDLVGRKETMTLNNGAAGLKFNLFGGLLLTADLLFRMDNNGLRQDVTPLIGLSHAWGK